MQLPSFDRRLALEITSVLIVKCTLLWLAWFAWFSHPAAKDMNMPPQLVRQQILGAPASGPALRTPGETSR
ncbi:cytochrome oxidase putative small subunit CydP [Silvimonas iriomotensis]|uniref:Uncharacterized protein n=1 Tax=Silvimonas iriomotensis TaxID=449662 RepID=A0ABQ2P802_9NEIS|nr:cytochrome oxidase putative small subunit CydP [Silvimonas iriomotensis]GGP20636.1 hypothetical protein GCM10010970_16200 [Silvimonas iriomotensis]